MKQASGGSMATMTVDVETGARKSVSRGSMATVTVGTESDANKSPKGAPVAK